MIRHLPEAAGKTLLPAGPAGNGILESLGKIIGPILRQNSDQIRRLRPVLSRLETVRPILWAIGDDQLVDGKPLRPRNLHQNARTIGDRDGDRLRDQKIEGMKRLGMNTEGGQRLDALGGLEGWCQERLKDVEHALRRDPLRPRSLTWQPETRRLVQFRSLREIRAGAPGFAAHHKLLIYNGNFGRYQACMTVQYHRRRPDENVVGTLSISGSTSAKGSFALLFLS